MDRDGLSKHRLEALADGIFAVAMTLLVIELKLPEQTSVHMSRDLMVGVANLIPKFVAWIISFFVLGIFWFSHHRLFHYVRLVDAKLVWLNIVYLSFVSLMPFSSAIVGQYPQFLFSQAFYSANQMMLATLSILISGHVFAHPGLWSTPITSGFYRAARFRSIGLILVAGVAIGITRIVPGAGNAAFMLMAPIAMVSARIERRG